MSKSSSRPVVSGVSKPEWAQYEGAPSVDKTCEVIRSPMWSGCAGCAARAVKVFVKVVEHFNGVVAFCVTLIGAFLTLYLLMKNMPQPVDQLKKVYLPAGDAVAAGPVLGEGAIVEWETAGTQKCEAYYCERDCGDGPCCRQAETGEGTFNAQRPTLNAEGVNAGSVVHGSEVQRLGAALRAAKVEIIGAYETIRVGKRLIDLSRKYKARSFLQFVHGRVKGGDGRFFVEEMRELYNKQFGARLAKKAWRSDRLKEDLFKGLADGDFELLFEVVNQSTGEYRLMI